ncbi:hypothetical protein EYF80_045527 [Liparis tanakae]|uniref:Uncharacterized protein n=1 Tax=Liparis tanakae TaxID=230148 RepID=A0A4Z2FVE2_9TELE|nr:hypothetical protein EYF80_045527 [Liparis tanakae]
MQEVRPTGYHISDSVHSPTTWLMIHLSFHEGLFLFSASSLSLLKTGHLRKDGNMEETGLNFVSCLFAQRGCSRSICHPQLTASRLASGMISSTGHVRLQLTALHLQLTLCRVRAHHRQLVQQVPDQQAGGTALMQLQPQAVHGAEVLLLQKVAEAMEAVRVATRGVHRSEEGLQADVANQLIVHLVLVLVQVAVQALVLLATLLTDARPREARGADAAGHFGFRRRHWLKKISPHSSGNDQRSLISLKPAPGHTSTSNAKNPFKLKMRG